VAVLHYNVTNFRTPCVQVFKSVVRGQLPSDDVIPNSVYLHTYIIYLRQTYTVERNLLMIEALQSSKSGDGKKNRPQDFARLYEIIVQVGSGGNHISLPLFSCLSNEFFVSVTAYSG